MRFVTGPIFLVGGGGHASDVLNLIERCGRLAEVAGYYDDDAAPARMQRWGVSHLGPAAGARFETGSFVLGVGMPATKVAVLAVIHVGDAIPLTLVDPAAVIGYGAELGPGTVVFPGGVVSAMASLGQHGLIHHHAVIGHDTVVGARCSVMPGATVSGDCVLGDDVLIGTNAAVRQGVTVGAGARVGAGAAVVADVLPGVTVIGVPARAQR